VKILEALGRLVNRSEPPSQPANPFDDGLTELARLIALEEPAGGENAEARPAHPDASA
jgi:hypothetical protein